MAAVAFRMMPVQQTGSFASAGTIPWSLPLDDDRSEPGSCSPNWGSLLATLTDARVNDGNRDDVVYYGLLPAAIPLSVPGCGKGGLGSAATGNTRTFVHEIGHGYGFQHTPAGPTGTPDSAYPMYEPYMSASIGEYGVDIQTGTVYSPATSHDYMSYGANRWMSLYQHRRLISHTRLAPTWIPERSPLIDVPILIDPRPWWLPEPPWGPDNIETYTPRPLISVRGFIDESGVVRVDSVARVTASATMHGPEISWNAQLVGKSGDVAARARLTRVLTQGGCGCGCSSSSGSQKNNPDRLPLEFHAMIPDVEVGTALRILDSSGNQVWKRYSPDTPVRFVDVKASLVSDDKSVVKFVWRLSKDDGFDVWAQHSADGGKAWHGLSVGLGNGLAEVDIPGVPAGKVLVRLLARDGFSTAKADPVEVLVPQRAPHPAILYPAEGEAVPANTEIELLGSAVDQGGLPVDDGLLEWFVDGKSFGHGRAPTLKVKPGNHKLALRANTQHAAEAAVTFTARAIKQ